MAETTQRVWAEVPHAVAGPLPDQLADVVTASAPDPADWTLAAEATLPQVRAFVGWRRSFLHVVPIGEVPDLGVLSAWLGRDGLSVQLDRDQSLDQAAITRVWWAAQELDPAHPAVRRCVDQLAVAAALSRSHARSTRLRVRVRRWPTTPC